MYRIPLLPQPSGSHTNQKPLDKPEPHQLHMRLMHILYCCSANPTLPGDRVGHTGGLSSHFVRVAWCLFLQQAALGPSGIPESLKCPPPPATKTRPGTLNSGSQPWTRIETGSHVLFMTLVSITTGAAQERNCTQAEPPHTKTYSIINPVPLLPQPNGSKQQSTWVLLFYDSQMQC
jgi:hypothetical protein